MKTLKILIFLVLIFTTPFIWLFINFIPSALVQAYWQYVFFGSLALAIIQFIKLKNFWMKIGRLQIGKEGGVKSELGAFTLTIFFGIGLPFMLLYLAALNTGPFLITYVNGKLGSQIYI